MGELLDFNFTRSLNNIMVAERVFYGTCPYCGGGLVKRYHQSGYASYYQTEDFYWHSYACVDCGWWWTASVPNKSWSRGETLVAMLNRVISCPPPVLQSIYEITANLERIYLMSPTKFESFVGSVFKAFYDCDVIHCGKSHDGGIDLLILESDLGYIPVQVKRRTRSDKTEPVSIVREFHGAMLLEGYNRGKIVTTADHFSKEAVEASTTTPYSTTQQCIDLIDCRRLLTIMKLVSSGQPDRSISLSRNVLPSPEPQEAVKKRIIKELEQFSEKYSS